MRKGLRQAMIVLGICMCLGGCEKETEAKTEPEEIYAELELVPCPAFPDLHLNVPLLLNDVPVT